MQWWQPIVLFIVLGGGAMFYYRRHNELDLLTGEPLSWADFRRSNPDLTIEPADKSSRMMRIRSKSNSLIAYAEFADGVPATAVTMATVSRSAASVLPDWAPHFPGARSPVYLEWQDASGPHAEITFTTGDPPQKVHEFFDAETKNAGWSGRALSGTGVPKRGEVNIWRGSVGCYGDEGRRLNIYLFGPRLGPTTFAIAFQRARRETAP